MGVKHKVLPDCQPPTVAFTVLAQLCGPKANETEMGATLFTKNGAGRNFDFDLNSNIFLFSFLSIHISFYRKNIDNSSFEIVEVFILLKKLLLFQSLISLW